MWMTLTTECYGSKRSTYKIRKAKCEYNPFSTFNLFFNIVNHMVKWTNAEGQRKHEDSWQIVDDKEFQNWTYTGEMKTIYIYLC